MRTWCAEGGLGDFGFLDLFWLMFLFGSYGLGT